MRGGNAQYGRLQTLPNGLKEINQRRYKRENGERQRQPFYVGKPFEGHVKFVLRAFSRIFHAKNLSEKSTREFHVKIYNYVKLTGKQTFNVKIFT